MTRRVHDRARVGLERLDEHTPGRVAATATGELREELERTLLGTEVRQREPGVRVDDRCELDAGEMVTLRNHLRPDQHHAIARREAAQRVGGRAGVGIESDSF